MARSLHILSGGAAQGLVSRLQVAFEAKHGCALAGTFGAVGAMKDKLLAGAACDVLILSQKLIDDLAAQGKADASSARPVGQVKTGVALKVGREPVAIRSEQDLKALLSAAGAIYFPDPAKATAGIHFMKVLQALGLADDARKLRTFPNGATAMAELAKAPEMDAVGCTQVTEILITNGVHLTGLLPAPHELTTTYTAAVASGAQEPELARALIEALTAADAAPVRRECGFE
ncbi:molybdate ABC transporter substrate-binding protein [Ramlibacter alkalitolerans]|uniref:Substrate-binding domain-containing protein n=1 Tax=Ramlibacter alkalitolerans TaxID=2039631 RepID=A0ABS1JU34_9BURK|nr:substrate-binding domain-containing protein [Ramlibacter alkalitolerans]MBL0427366.1 substrate-binding domain-containing protein [Ramlibacter alkalitolerans]